MSGQRGDGSPLFICEGLYTDFRPDSAEVLFVAALLY